MLILIDQVRQQHLSGVSAESLFQRHHRALHWICLRVHSPKFQFCRWLLGLRHWLWFERSLDLDFERIFRRHFWTVEQFFQRRARLIMLCYKSGLLLGQLLLEPLVASLLSPLVLPRLADYSLRHSLKQFRLNGRCLCLPLLLLFTLPLCFIDGFRSAINHHDVFTS